MTGRPNLALLAPGLAFAAAVVCLLRAVVELPRLLGGFGLGVSLWVPLVSVLVATGLAVVTAGAASASVVRPSPWAHAAAALTAGALAGYVGPDVLQRLVLVLGGSGLSGLFGLFWSFVGSALAVAAALAAFVRLAQELAGGGGTHGPRGAGAGDTGSWGAGGGAATAWPPAER